MFAFDRGYSIWMLTAAAGGEFYDLAGPKTNLAFCPLRDIDDDADLAWAVGWMESLMRAERPCESLRGIGMRCPTR